MHTRTDTPTDTPTDKRTHTPTDKHTNTHSRKPLYLESVERERDAVHENTSLRHMERERAGDRVQDRRERERESEFLRECGEGRKDESRRESERK